MTRLMEIAVFCFGGLGLAMLAQEALPYKSSFRYEKVPDTPDPFSCKLPVLAYSRITAVIKVTDKIIPISLRTLTLAPMYSERAQLHD